MFDIECLPQRYDIKRRGITFWGEVCIVRPIDHRDREDMRTMKSIREVMERCGYFPDEPVSAQGLDYDLITWVARESVPDDHNGFFPLEWIAGADVTTEGVLIGVAGNFDTGAQATGSLQGWVYALRLEQREVDEIRAVLNRSDMTDKNILMLSYIKDRDARSGQMSSAVRQVCLMISRTSAVIGKDAADIHVVVAIDPGNCASIYTAESAGFKKRGQIRGTRSEWDSLYALDWELLHRIVHRRCDAELTLNEAILSQPNRMLLPWPCQ